MPAWTHRIILDGVDITAQTVLPVRIEEAERASAICEFRWHPPTGQQDTDALLLDSLTIDADVGSGWQPLFNGVAASFVWNQRERYYTVKGSNRLQEYFRALGSEDAILAALPGAVYSEAVFGEPPDDLWEYAQLCMQTLESDVHLDRTGALRIVPWLPKATPDDTVGATVNGVHHRQAFSLRRPSADDLTNEIKLEYQYRVQRKKIRKHSISWSAWSNNTPIDSFCEWAVGPDTQYTFVLPHIARLQDTLLGGSWSVPAGIRFATFPPSQTDLCAVDTVWIRPDGAEQVALTAGADGYRATSQPVWEKYNLTISAPAAQTLYGSTVTVRRSGALDVPRLDDWPPQNVEAPTWPQDAIGDYYDDVEEESERQNDLQCGYQWALWKIRGSNRLTELDFYTDLRPDYGLDYTIQASAYDLTTKSKVRRLVYTLSASQDNPSTAVTLAIFRGNNGSTTPWAVPARPDTTTPGYPAPPASTSLQTHVGGWSGAVPQPDPDERDGWVTNVQDNATGYDPTNLYSAGFRVTWPEVEAEASDEIEVDVPSSWDISIPHDPLTTG